MSDEGVTEGIRLAKRVAALQGCSRSQAEALIAAGVVQVDGQTVTDPARRVPDALPVRVTGDASGGALTVLLHKPAALTAGQALRQAWPALEQAQGAALPAGLQEWLPLPKQASGLSVWSDERPVVRRLQDRERPLETEWRLTLPMAAAASVIGPLQQGGMRASLGHEREGVGQWRLVDKGDRGEALVDFLDQCQLGEGWTLHRLRVGRLGVSPLTQGQARLRLGFEKF